MRAGCRDDARSHRHHGCRVDALRWIINNQLGRRNLDPLQKDVLIGRRYELEKREDRGHGDQKSGGENPRPNLAEQLAEEYQVVEKTVRQAGEFVQGLDELATVREDLPQSVLTKQTHGETKGLAQGKAGHDMLDTGAE